MARSKRDDDASDDAAEEESGEESVVSEEGGVVFEPDPAFAEAVANAPEPIPNMAGTYVYMGEYTEHRVLGVLDPVVGTYEYPASIQADAHAALQALVEAGVLRKA